MIFYIADDVGHTKLLGTQADAKAVNKQFTQVDIPTDKRGLMAFVQKLYDDIYDLEHGAEDAGLHFDTTPVGVDQYYETPPALNVETFPEGLTAPPPTLDDLNVATLEAQVVALGTAGAAGLDQFDGWEQICGVSVAFSRGVHLLNVIASGEHQLARIFLRKKLK